MYERVSEFFKDLKICNSCVKIEFGLVEPMLGMFKVRGHQSYNT
jgi:hypothetical protein